MIKGILIGLGALAATALIIADQIGEAIQSLAEDTQEWPSCDNCRGKGDMEYCRFCRDGSCWEHRNESLYEDPED